MQVLHLNKPLVSSERTLLVHVSRPCSSFHSFLHFCYVYIDDVLIASSIPEEHLHHSWLVLNDHGILINVSKSLLGHAEFKKPKRYCDSSLGNVLKCDCMVCGVQRIPMTPISLSSWSSLMLPAHTRCLAP